MSISQNFPDEGPTLSLNFASSKTLDPRITFTRASTGTYTDDNGLVVIAPTDTPRFDHNPATGESLGLLVEEARTNLLLRSEEFDNAYWSPSGSSITANNTTAPNGTITADLLIENSASSTHLVSVGGKMLSGTTYTYSVYAKAAGRDWLIMSPGSTWGYGWFNINNGTLGTLVDGGSNPTAAINAVGNGWYRCSITLTAVANAGIQFLMVPSNGLVTYTGNGTSGIYLWGAQLEAGAFPTSYIPTTTSTATRSADNVSVTGTNFSSWYNQTAAATGGTILAQGRRGYGGNFLGYPNFHGLNDGTSSNIIATYGVLGNTQFTNYSMQTSGVSQTDYVAVGVSTTNLFKSAHAFATNNSTFCVDGTLTTTDTSVTLPSLNRLSIGSPYNSIGNWGGTISSLSYYPRALSSSQLQTLTK